MKRAEARKNKQKQSVFTDDGIGVVWKSLSVEVVNCLVNRSFNGFPVNYHTKHSVELPYLFVKST